MDVCWGVLEEILHSWVNCSNQSLWLWMGTRCSLSCVTGLNSASPGRWYSMALGLNLHTFFTHRNSTLQYFFLIRQITLMHISVLVRGFGSLPPRWPLLSFRRQWQHFTWLAAHVSRLCWTSPYIRLVLNHFASPLSWGCCYEVLSVAAISHPVSLLFIHQTTTLA